MIILDTTVLVYATGAEHRLREPCRRLVDAISRSVIEATTTVEVVQAFLHVRSQRRRRADAVDLALAYADLLSPMLPVTLADLRAGLRLYGASNRLSAFDAVLAAAAMAAHADALVSADAAFAEIRGLEHVVPDGAAVSRLLPG